MALAGIPIFTVFILLLVRVRNRRLLDRALPVFNFVHVSRDDSVDVEDRVVNRHPFAVLLFFVWCIGEAAHCLFGLAVQLSDVELLRYFQTRHLELLQLLQVHFVAGVE